jgi:hypothetical protein
MQAEASELGISLTPSPAFNYRDLNHEAASIVFFFLKRHIFESCTGQKLLYEKSQLPRSSDGDLHATSMAI